MKIFLSLIFILNFLFADNNSFISSLRDEFNEDVIETNIYKLHYKTYITKKCKSNEIVCIKNTIRDIKTWQDKKTTKFLKYKIKNRFQNVNLNMEYWKNVNKKLLQVIKEKDVLSSEYITLIDISKQLFIITLYDKKSNRISLIGSDLISSGNMEKEKEVMWGEDHYFETPIGVYENFLGWRSNGKLNEEARIKAYGEKESFVYYFGKQKSLRYNTFDKNGKKIYDKKQWKLISGYLNFAMHAYESSNNLGVPKSHGCIRMSNELNLFLDRNRVLHQNRLDSHLTNGKYNKNNFKNSKNKFSGKILVIVDSVS